MSSVARATAELANRLGADLWLYQNGVLAATSAPVLDELGLIDPLLAPPVFVRLALEDELEVTADGRTAGRPIRVGYRVVLAGPPRVQAILAAPQLLDDEAVRQQQVDLALALVVATLAGLVAAVVLAGLAGRGLARPVAALRDAAVAVGRGAPPPAFPPGAPREFVRDTRVLPLESSGGIRVDVIFGLLPVQRIAISRAVPKNIACPNDNSPP